MTSIWGVIPRLSWQHWKSSCWVFAGTGSAAAFPRPSLTTDHPDAHPNEAGLSWGLNLQKGAQGPAAPGGHWGTPCAPFPPVPAVPMGHRAGEQHQTLASWQRGCGNVECGANQPSLGVPTVERVLLSALRPKHGDLRLQVSTCSHQRACSIISKEVWMLNKHWAPVSCWRDSRATAGDHELLIPQAVASPGCAAPSHSPLQIPALFCRVSWSNSWVTVASPPKPQTIPGQLHKPPRSSKSRGAWWGLQWLRLHYFLQSILQNIYPCIMMN